MIKQLIRWPTNSRKVLDAIDGHLADGDEAADVVHFALQAAAVVAGDLGLDQHLFVEVAPVGHFGGRLGQAEIVEAVVGVEPLDDHLDGVARLGRLGKLPQGDAALLAAAQFDEHLVAPHGHDAAAVPRFRLEDLFIAAQRAAAHQGVEGLVAEARVELGVHVRREGILLGRLGGRHILDHRRRGRCSRAAGLADGPRGPRRPARATAGGGCGARRFGRRLLGGRFRLLDGGPITLPPPAIGRRITLRANENLTAGRFGRLVAGGRLRIDAARCWSPCLDTAENPSEFLVCAPQLPTFPDDVGQRGESRCRARLFHSIKLSPSTPRASPARQIAVSWTLAQRSIPVWRSPPMSDVPPTGEPIPQDRPFAIEVAERVRRSPPICSPRSIA